MQISKCTDRAVIQSAVYNIGQLLWARYQTILIASLNIYPIINTRKSTIYHLMRWNGRTVYTNANSNFNSSLFSEKELAVLEQIAARFMNTSTSDLIEISHKEKGWIENKDQKNLINYKYSFDLVG